MRIPSFALARLVDLSQRFGDRRGDVFEYGPALDWLERHGLIECLATWNEPPPPGERQSWSVRVTKTGREYLATQAMKAWKDKEATHDAP